MSSETYKKGFTLLEVLVALSIVGVLFTLSMSLNSAFRPKHNLDADVRSIISVFDLARSNTLASKDSLSFGIHVESDQVVMFEGDTYNPIASENEIFELDSKDEIYDISLEGGVTDVVFNRITGTLDQFGTLSFRVRRDPSETKVIYISSSGSISSTEFPVVVDSGLVSDSRHVHFDLGWSIQGATTIEFHFPNIPQIESVAMADYFGDSEFDWNGSFEVGGAAQEFQVHTHFLDAFDTELSITRNRNNGKNTERVEVRIVSGVAKSIATYLADSSDTIEVGAYGGVMDVQ